MNNAQNKSFSTNSASKTFTTMNRKLEQVLYNHGIMFISQHKNEDGMTVWSYERTAELESIVGQFRRSRACRPGIMRLAYVNPRSKKMEGAMSNV